MLLHIRPSQSDFGLRLWALKTEPDMYLGCASNYFIEPFESRLSTFDLFFNSGPQSDLHFFPIKAFFPYFFPLDRLLQETDTLSKT